MLGQRTARVQILRRGKELTGCQFYALQDSSYSGSEHLPGPHQPNTRITILRYASATAAHNAVAGLAASSKARNASRATVAHGATGVTYRASFDPEDNGNDWVCAFYVGTTVGVVETANTTDQTDAIGIADTVIDHLI